MSEIKTQDGNEFRKAETENYRDIKPESDLKFSDAASFLNESADRFSEFGPHYNTYKDCLDQTPKSDSEKGEWAGEKGESLFVPSEGSPEGKAAKEKLDEYGLSGVEYINAEPDFSKCSEATVEIPNMTENRQPYVDENGEVQQGNFSQADQALSDQWNAERKDGRSDWTAKDVKTYRHDNKLSWHERCDTKTMDLVPSDIHSYFPHLGGCSECKVRDSKDNIGGGGFDE